MKIVISWINTKNEKNKDKHIELENEKYIFQKKHR